ncbi:MAG: VOC family protein [Fusobacteriota bacterium]
MKAKISLVTIWTDNIEPMTRFYCEIMGFKVKNDLGMYIELENEGVRFAICKRKVMYDYSSEYKKDSYGQKFELAFPCENVEDLDESYKELIEKGATPIEEPQNMPWGQRTALFADPDGNIHELFCELK